MENFKIIDGKKYGLDGEDYESESAAKENLSKYSNNGFETHLIEEEGKYFVYTRRVAGQVESNG